MTSVLDRLAAFPRIKLAHLPTPLERLDRLSAHIAAAGGPVIWVKRDDCTGLGLGGNKVRKLEYLMADALAEGADAVVTGGVVQSNHVRQTAAAAAKLGLACHLAIMTGRVPRTDPDYDDTGNIFLDRLFGAHCTLVDWRADRNAVIARLLDALRRDGKKPYFIPYGGSSAVGALGFVRCVVEMLDQANAVGMRIGHVVLASGSAGTQAGLVVGLAALAPEVRVIGIDIDAEPERVRADVGRVALETARRLAFSPALLDNIVPAIEVVGGHAGPGYGLVNKETVEAIRLAAELEGLLFDPVYSGKGLAGCIELVRSGRFAPRENVLFVHSGGIPALFAYRSAFAAGA